MLELAQTSEYSVRRQTWDGYGLKCQWWSCRIEQAVFQLCKGVLLYLSALLGLYELQPSDKWVIT